MSPNVEPLAEAQRERDLTPAERRTFWRRALILLSFATLLAVVATSDDVHRWLSGSLTLAGDLIGSNPVAGGAFFLVLAALSAALSFLSVAILVPAAVVAWGVPATLGLLWSGWMLGGLTTYCVGRFVGRRVVRWVAPGPLLQEIEQRVQRDAPVWFVILLQLALPSEIPGYVLGLARYPLHLYALSLALAELPYALATVELGSSFLERKGVAVLTIGVAITTLSLAAAYRLRRHVRALARRRRSALP